MIKVQCTCGELIDTEPIEGSSYLFCGSCKQAMRVDVSVKTRQLTVLEVADKSILAIRNNTTALGAFIRKVRDVCTVTPEEVSRATRAVENLDAFADSLAPILLERSKS